MTLVSRLRALLALAALAAAVPAQAGEARPALPAERVTALEAELQRVRAELRQAAERLAQAEAARVAAEQSAAAEAQRLSALETALQQLEQSVARLTEEQRQTGDTLDRMSEGEGRRPTLTVYGTLDGSKYRGQNSILDAQAFELVLSGRPRPRLGFFAELEFERVAGVGGERGGEIVVEQAYANYAFSSAFNLRAGALLVPFGNVNIDHYAPRRDVVSRPLVAYVVAPSDWTDNGLGLYGRAVFGASWVLDYETYVIAGLGGTIDALGTRRARQGYGVDNNNDKALVGRFALGRSGRFTLGLSGYTGKYDDANRRRLNGWAADALAQFGPLKLTGEYDAMLADRGPERATRLRGFYGRAVIDFGRALLVKTIARGFDEPRLQGVFQYDEVRVDGPFEGAFIRNRERRTTLGLNFRPAREWVLKLNWERNRSQGRPLLQGDAEGFVGSIGFVF